MRTGAMRQKQPGEMVCRKSEWHGREAYRLSNGVVELTTLTGGGHIAEFRLIELDGAPGMNPLWVPPWDSMDSHRYREAAHKPKYGTLLEGKLLAGIAGHNLCLDYFGAPSGAEAAQGLSQHGEAPSLPWSKAGQETGKSRASVTLGVRLPEAGLRFERRITLRKGQTAAWFTETVQNERKADHFFHWVQHVTLGPPFISQRASAAFLPGTRGMTFPFGYGNRALLQSGKEFRWPNAPLRSGGRVNLENVLIRRGFGFVASALVDPRREWGYVCALNRKHRLLIGYCFRREDFPWVAVWEENRAHSAPPWRKRTETRGLEFGSTPIPSTRRDVVGRGNLFGTETFTCIPGLGRKTIEYVAFLARIPAGVQRISNIRFSGHEIQIRGDSKEVIARVLCR